MPRKLICCLNVAVAYKNSRMNLLGIIHFFTFWINNFFDAINTSNTIPQILFLSPTQLKSSPISPPGGLNREFTVFPINITSTVEYQSKLKWPKSIATDVLHSEGFVQIPCSRMRGNSSGALILGGESEDLR